MQGGLVRRKLSVRLSDRKSDNGVHCDKKEERSVQIFIPYKRPFSSVFLEKMVGGGDPFYLKFWVNRPSLKRNGRF